MQVNLNSAAAESGFIKKIKNKKTKRDSADPSPAFLSGIKPKKKKKLLVVCCVTGKSKVMSKN